MSAVTLFVGEGLSLIRADEVRRGDTLLLPSGGRVTVVDAELRYVNYATITIAGGGRIDIALSSQVNRVVLA